MKNLNNLTITKIEDGFYRFSINQKLNGLKEVLYNLSTNPFKILESYLSNFQEALNNNVEIAISEEGYVYIYYGLQKILSLTRGGKKTLNFTGDDPQYVEKKLIAHMCDEKFYERMIAVFAILTV